MASMRIVAWVPELYAFADYPHGDTSRTLTSMKTTEAYTENPFPHRTAHATVDLGAMAHNLAVAKSQSPESNVMAVIKANAYGHGMVAILSALRAADALAVACVDEGVLLRSYADKPIVVLQGFHTPLQWQQCQQYQLSPVIHQLWQIEIVQQAPATTEVTFWLKMNTGMNRLGVPPQEYQQAHQTLAELPNVKQVVAMTHMASADEFDNAQTGEQMAVFNHHLPSIVSAQSMANSAMILRADTPKGDWMRPGIMLYGVNPFVLSAEKSHADSLKQAEKLRPVMTLRSKVVACQTYPKGARIGYGGDWVCERDTRAAVVAIGYGDGYPRHARSGTPVLINGVLCPLLGRVSMDMITVDVTNLPACAVGDEAVLWGEGLPVERVAEHAGTIAYELLCSVSNRVVKRYI